MTYTPEPQSSGSTLRGTRDTIRGNFEIIETDFAVDHVQFDDTGEGKHKHSTYIAVGTPPTTIANESAIWSADGTASSQAELYIRQESQTGALSVGDKDYSIYGVSAAGLFSGAGAAVGSHNVNLAASGTIGVYTMTFTNNLPTVNYMAFVQIENSTRLISFIDTKAVSGFRIIITTTAGTQAAPTGFSVMVYGELEP